MSISLPKPRKNILLVLILILIASCNVRESKYDNYKSIERFEKLFYNSNSNDLEKLKKKYPFFFPESYPKDVWLKRLNDPIQQEIFDEIIKAYDNLDFLESEIYSFFKNHNEYLNENIDIKIISVNTDIDYSNRIILTDSILLIGLDNYLGKDHRFYKNFPSYIREDLTRNNIISDISERFALNSIPKVEYYTFLDRIIFYGKILYYKDKCLTNYPDNYKIGYSSEKMQWARDNEYFVWSYFIENEILFDPSIKLNNRFINDAPFSTFNFENDNQTTEMIGKYIGWNIVKSYMQNNDVSLIDMLYVKPIDIYIKSNYKPKK